MAFRFSNPNGLTQGSFEDLGKASLWYEAVFCVVWNNNALLIAVLSFNCQLKTTYNSCEESLSESLSITSCLVDMSGGYSLKVINVRRSSQLWVAPSPRQGILNGI